MHSFFLWHFCKFLFLQSLQFVLHPYVRQWAWVQHRLPSYQCHQSLSQSEAMPRAELPPEDEWSQVPIVKRVLLLFLLPLWRPKLCLKKPACTATMVVILINYKDHTVHCMCICDWLQGFFSSLHVQTEVFSSISMKRIMMYTSFGCQCRRKQLRRFGGVAGEWFGCIGILKWWCPRCYWIHHEVSLECLACNRCNPQQNYLCIVYISRRYSYIYAELWLILSWICQKKTWFTNLGSDSAKKNAGQGYPEVSTWCPCVSKCSGSTALRTQIVAYTRGSTKMACLVWSLVCLTECHYGHLAWWTKNGIIPASLISWKCTSDFKCAIWDYDVRHWESSIRVGGSLAQMGTAHFHRWRSE